MKIRNTCKILVEKPPARRHLGDIGVDDTIKLKLTLLAVMMWNAFNRTVSCGGLL
jgi:hypothetical protein